LPPRHRMSQDALNHRRVLDQRDQPQAPFTAGQARTSRPKLRRIRSTPRRLPVWTIRDLGGRMVGGIGWRAQHRTRSRHSSWTWTLHLRETLEWRRRPALNRGWRFCSAQCRPKRKGNLRVLLRFSRPNLVGVGLVLADNGSGLGTVLGTAPAHPREPHCTPCPPAVGSASTPVSSWSPQAAHDRSPRPSHDC